MSNSDASESSTTVRMPMLLSYQVGNCICDEMPQDSDAIKLKKFSKAAIDVDVHHPYFRKYLYRFMGWQLSISPNQLFVATLQLFTLTIASCGTSASPISTPIPLAMTINPAIRSLTWSADSNYILVLCPDISTIFVFNAIDGTLRHECKISVSSSASAASSLRCLDFWLVDDAHGRQHEVEEKFCTDLHLICDNFRVITIRLDVNAGQYAVLSDGIVVSRASNDLLDSSLWVSAQRMLVLVSSSKSTTSPYRIHVVRFNKLLRNGSNPWDYLHESALPRAETNLLSSFQQFVSRHPTSNNQTYSSDTPGGGWLSMLPNAIVSAFSSTTAQQSPSLKPFIVQMTVSADGRMIAILQSDSTTSVYSIGGLGVSCVVRSFSVNFPRTADDADGIVSIPAASLHFISSIVLTAISSMGDVIYLGLSGSDGSQILVVDDDQKLVSSLVPRLGPLYSTAITSQKVSTLSPFDTTRCVVATMRIIDRFNSQLFVMRSIDTMRAITMKLRENSLSAALALAKSYGVDPLGVRQLYWSMIKRNRQVAGTSTDFASMLKDPGVNTKSALLAKLTNRLRELKVDLKDDAADVISDQAFAFGPATITQVFGADEYWTDERSQLWCVYEALTFIDADADTWQRILMEAERVTECAVFSVKEVINGPASSDRCSPTNVMLFEARRLLRHLRRRIEFAANLDLRLHNGTSNEQFDSVDVLWDNALENFHPNIDRRNGVLADSNVIFNSSNSSRIASEILSVKHVTNLSVASNDRMKIAVLALSSLEDLAIALAHLLFVDELRILLLVFPFELAHGWLNLVAELPMTVNPNVYAKLLPAVICNTVRLPLLELLISESKILSDLKGRLSSKGFAALTAVMWFIPRESSITLIFEGISSCEINLGTLNEFHKGLSRQAGNSNDSTYIVSIAEVAEHVELEVLFGSLQTSELLHQHPGFALPDEEQVLDWYIRYCLSLELVGLTSSALIVINTAITTYQFTTEMLGSSGQVSFPESFANFNVARALHSELCWFARSLSQSIIPVNVSFLDWLVMGPWQRLDFLLDATFGPLSQLSAPDILVFFSAHVKEIQLSLGHENHLGCRKLLDEIVFGSNQSTNSACSQPSWVIDTVSRKLFECDSSRAIVQPNRESTSIGDTWQYIVAIRLSKYCEDGNENALRIAVTLAEESKPTLLAPDRKLGNTQALVTLVLLSCIQYDDLQSGLPSMWQLIETTPASFDADFEPFLCTAMDDLQSAFISADIIKKYTTVPPLSVMLTGSVYQELVKYLNHLIEIHGLTTLWSKGSSSQDNCSTVLNIHSSSHRGLQRIEFVQKLLSGLGYLFVAMETDIEEFCAKTLLDGISDGKTVWSADYMSSTKPDKACTSSSSLCNRVSFAEAVVTRMVCSFAETESGRDSQRATSFRLRRCRELIDNLSELCQSYFTDVSSTFVARVVFLSFIQHELMDVVAHIVLHVVSIETLRHANPDCGLELGFLPEDDPDTGDGVSVTVGEALARMGLRIEDCFLFALHKSSELMNSACSFEDTILLTVEGLLDALPEQLATSVVNTSHTILRLYQIAKKERAKLRLTRFFADAGVEFPPLLMVSLSQLLKCALASRPAAIEILNRNKVLPGRIAQINDLSLAGGDSIVDDQSELIMDVLSSLDRNIAMTTGINDKGFNHNEIHQSFAEVTLLKGLLVDSDVPGSVLIKLLQGIFGDAASIKLQILLALLSAAIRIEDLFKMYQLLKQVFRLDNGILSNAELRNIDEAVQMVAVILADSRKQIGVTPGKLLAYRHLCEDICASYWTWCSIDYLSTWTVGWRDISTQTVCASDVKDSDVACTRLYKSNDWSSGAEFLCRTSSPAQTSMTLALNDASLGESGHINTLLLSAARESLNVAIASAISGHPAIGQATATSAVQSISGIARITDALMYLQSLKGSFSEVMALGVGLIDAISGELENKFNALLVASAATSSRSSTTSQSHLNESFVTSLVQKGFSRNGAKRAVLATNSASLDKAFSWAIEHSGDSEFDLPIAQSVAGALISRNRPTREELNPERVAHALDLLSSLKSDFIERQQARCDSSELKPENSHTTPQLPNNLSIDQEAINVSSQQLTHLELNGSDPPGPRVQDIRKFAEIATTDKPTDTVQNLSLSSAATPATISKLELRLATACASSSFDSGQSISQTSPRSDCHPSARSDSEASISYVSSNATHSEATASVLADNWDLDLDLILEEDTGVLDANIIPDEQISFSTAEIPPREFDSTSESQEPKPILISEKETTKSCVTMDNDVVSDGDDNDDVSHITPDSLVCSARTQISQVSARTDYFETPRGVSIIGGIIEDSRSPSIVTRVTLSDVLESLTEPLSDRSDTSTTFFAKSTIELESEVLPPSSESTLEIVPPLILPTPAMTTGKSSSKPTAGITIKKMQLTAKLSLFFEQTQAAIGMELESSVLAAGVVEIAVDDASSLPGTPASANSNPIIATPSPKVNMSTKLRIDSICPTLIEILFRIALHADVESVNKLDEFLSLLPNVLVVALHDKLNAYIVSALPSHNIDFEINRDISGPDARELFRWNLVAFRFARVVACINCNISASKEDSSFTVISSCLSNAIFEAGNTADLEFCSSSLIKIPSRYFRWLILSYRMAPSHNLMALEILKKMAIGILSSQQDQLRTPVPETQFSVLSHSDLVKILLMTQPRLHELTIDEELITSLSWSSVIKALNDDIAALRRIGRVPSSDGVSAKALLQSDEIIDPRMLISTNATEEERARKRNALLALMPYLNSQTVPAWHRAVGKSLSLSIPQMLYYFLSYALAEQTRPPSSQTPSEVDLPTALTESDIAAIFESELVVCAKKMKVEHLQALALTVAGIDFCGANSAEGIISFNELVEASSKSGERTLSNILLSSRAKIILLSSLVSQLAKSFSANVVSESSGSPRPVQAGRSTGISTALNPSIAVEYLQRLSKFVEVIGIFPPAIRQENALNALILHSQSLRQNECIQPESVSEFSAIQRSVDDYCSKALLCADVHDDYFGQVVVGLVDTVLWPEHTSAEDSVHDFYRVVLKLSVGSAVESVTASLTSVASIETIQLSQGLIAKISNLELPEGIEVNTIRSNLLFEILKGVSVGGFNAHQIVHRSLESGELSMITEYQRLIIARICHNTIIECLQLNDNFDLKSQSQHVHLLLRTIYLLRRAHIFCLQNDHDMTLALLETDEANYMHDIDSLVGTTSHNAAVACIAKIISTWLGFISSNPELELELVENVCRCILAMIRMWSHEFDSIPHKIALQAICWHGGRHAQSNIQDGIHKLDTHPKLEKEFEILVLRLLEVCFDVGLVELCRDMLLIDVGILRFDIGNSLPSADDDGFVASLTSLLSKKWRALTTKSRIQLSLLFGGLSMALGLAILQGDIVNDEQQLSTFPFAVSPLQSLSASSSMPGLALDPLSLLLIATSEPKIFERLCPFGSRVPSPIAGGKKNENLWLAILKQAADCTHPDYRITDDKQTNLLPYKSPHLQAILDHELKYIYGDKLVSKSLVSVRSNEDVTNRAIMSTGVIQPLPWTATPLYLILRMCLLNHVVEAATICWTHMGRPNELFSVPSGMQLLLNVLKSSLALADPVKSQSTFHRLIRISLLGWDNIEDVSAAGWNEVAICLVNESLRILQYQAH